MTLMQQEKPQYKLWIFEFLIFLLLLAASIIVRLPFFFEADVGWDESTFILVAQAFLDGDLPYTKLWDLKPPLAFTAFTIPIVIFGKSITGVRLFGALCLALAAFFVFQTSRRFVSKRLAFFLSCLVIMAVSTMPGGQAVLTEHIAIVPLTWAMALAALPALTIQRAFFIGCLIACACMVRLNLGVVALFYGLCVLLYYKYETLGRRLSCAVVYALGGLVVVFLTLLPYLLTGQSMLWWDSVVIAPLKYSNEQYGIVEVFFKQAAHSLGIYKRGENIYTAQTATGLMLWLPALFGFYLLKTNWSQLDRQQRSLFLMAAVYFTSVGLSIIVGGAAHAHYLIQLMPSAALLAALTYGKITQRLGRPPLIVFAVCILTGFALRPIVGQYRTLAEQLETSDRMLFGPAVEITDFLRRHCPGKPLPYFFTDHIAYWFMGVLPPTKVAHPSSVGREYLLSFINGYPTSSAQEIKNIFSQKPDYIIKHAEVWYLRGHEDALKLLEKRIELDYTKIATIRKREIYERRGIACPR